MAIDALGAIPAVSFCMKTARSLMIRPWIVDRIMGLVTCCRYKGLHISFQRPKRQPIASDRFDIRDDVCLWSWCDFEQPI